VYVSIVLLSHFQRFIGTHKHYDEINVEVIWYIQAIKTEQNYDKALLKIEELWGVAEGTEEANKLEVLTHQRGISLDMIRSLHANLSIPC
jgi:antitoxin component HigA of HigAB toxin-antitoxin module